jgi:dihydroneopterin aldolase
MPEYTILLDELEVESWASASIRTNRRRSACRCTVAMTCRYDAPPEDRIDAVVDYDFLRREIHALATARHFALQEVLCDEVAALALRDAARP